MNKLNPHYVVKAYETPEALEKYKNAIIEVGLWKSEEKIITQFVQTKSPILELGCGVGRVAYNIYKLGYHNITGVDLSKNMIKEAKKFAKSKNVNINYYVGDAMKLNLSENYYDCILFMFNGLMLIPGFDNRLKVLKEVKRILNKGGYFIFTSHDINANDDYKSFWDQQKLLWSRGENNKQLYEYGDLIDSEIVAEDSFIHFPNNNEILNMADMLNFEVVFSDFRDNIVEENEKVKSFSGNTKFWVFKK
ncbi:MAG: methyltransferase domain-containing protein [bacterium]|nr:methyltransferase domain-containing protein [bacterium]